MKAVKENPGWIGDQGDFIAFCETQVFVEDKYSHRPVRFKLWPCQKRVAQQLVAGDWLAILKARRLGLTWLLVAYAVWLLRCRSNRQIVVVNQDKEYAQDFLDRVRFVQGRLPENMENARATDNLSRMSFNASSKVAAGSLIRSVACTKRAIRSLSADLIIFDEAAYMELLKKARQAAQPAVENGNGQIVLISTSNGPSGDFYDVWTGSYQKALVNAAKPDGENTKPPKYKPVFLHWNEHPRRNENWYRAEKEENKSDPLYMKREYPSSPAEAFESAQGRVYPMFTVYPPAGEKFIQRLRREESWTHYRAIDFGGVDPFVCLWGCVVPHESPRLTIDPSCTNLIREMLAYSYDENERPRDIHNHTCDALRYMVVSAGANGINGHLHIYRELYVPDSAAKGLSLPDLAHQIMNASGSEEYVQTFADRSRPDSIVLLCQMTVSTVPHRTLSGGRHGEIEQGIARVTNLVVGTSQGEKAARIPELPFSRLPTEIARRGLYA